MQSDVLNEQQQQLSNDTDCSSSLSTTLIYSGLKLHPKPLVPTISMPGVASPLSIVKKLSLPDSHLDNTNNNIRHSSSNSTTTTTPSSIRLVTPTNKSSSSSTTNGTFSSSKTYILNPQQSSTTTVNKQQILSNPNSLLTLIPPGTTSPKIQTLNSVTISSTNDMSTTDKLSSSSTNSNQSVFLSKNRLTLVQPLITNTNSSTTNNHFWQQQQTQPTKIFSIPPSSILPTTKMLSRPVQLIPTDHHHITHIKNDKTDNNTNSYMHFGLSSPTTNENPLTPLNIQVPHQHSYSTKNFDSSGHQSYIHMQLLPSTSNCETINSSQFTFPHSSSVLISTTQRSMDYNNNHQSTITTPIIREMQIDEKLNDSTIIKNFKISTKNRTRLPLQPSTQQTSSTIRQPKKHKLIEDEQISSNEPPKKLPHYEQFNSSLNFKKYSIENTTPLLTSSMNINTKKFHSSQTTNLTLLSQKRKIIKKFNQTNENIKQNLVFDKINQSNSNIIDDELLQRLSQDFVYIDKQTGIRWIGRKIRPKPMSTFVSRFSWKPKINHYEKYSDIIRMNPKRILPVKSLDIIQKKLTQPWASWRIDRLTTYLSDLTQDEQITLNQLSDIIQVLDINDQSIRTTIEDLVQANIQRHRCFREQLTQTSNLLGNLLDHGNTLRDICSMSKTSTTKRTKDR